MKILHSSPILMHLPILIGVAAIVIITPFIVNPTQSNAVSGAETSFVVTEVPVTANQNGTYEVSSYYGPTLGDFRAVTFETNTPQETRHLAGLLSKLSNAFGWGGARDDQKLLCTNNLVDAIMFYASYSDPQCVPSSVCSGGFDGGNVVNSCTGALVQSCANGCSGGVCNAEACTPQSICSGGIFINSCTGTPVGGTCGSFSPPGSSPGSSSGGLSSGGSSPVPGSPPGGNGTSLPECSDGINNDNTNGTDYPNDPGCSSANDVDESTPPPTLHLTSSDRVRPQERAVIVWSTSSVAPGSCTLVGDNTPPNQWAGESGSQLSNPLTNETHFTLRCTDLAGHATSTTRTVRIAPSSGEE